MKAKAYAIQNSTKVYIRRVASLNRTELADKDRIAYMKTPMDSQVVTHQILNRIEERTEISDEQTIQIYTVIINLQFPYNL